MEVSRAPAFLAFNAEVAELGTRLMIGLIPEVLSVLLRDTPDSDCFEIGVGGTEQSSVRLNAWSTTDRKPGSP